MWSKIVNSNCKIIKDDRSIVAGLAEEKEG
jgi:hypothetical protein